MELLLVNSFDKEKAKLNNYSNSIATFWFYFQVNNSCKLYEMTEHQGTLREPLHCVLVKVKMNFSYV